MIPYTVLLPGSVKRGIVASGGSGGPLLLRRREAEKLLICTGAGNADGEMAESNTAFARSFQRLDATRAGGWVRATVQCHEIWDYSIRRNLPVPTELWREQVKVPELELHNDNATLVVTVVDRGGGDVDARSWSITAENAWPFFTEEFDEDVDSFQMLEAGWPMNYLATKKFTIVGLGSIGSAVLDVLLSYGIRQFTLVDPQRLQQKNLSRHRLGWNDVGRFKVAAFKEHYADRYPSAKIDALALDVEFSADVMRPIVAASDLVLAAPDGVVPRRVVSHLARRAGVPAILAAVLDDGRIGEILRLRPDFAVGCLTCQREAQEEVGGVELEQRIDPGYFEGTVDRPMTAVGGDLWLVGALAAKVAVATLLEAEGYVDQRLPGDHAVIGLHPSSDLADPFASSGPVDLHWTRGGPPRDGCPTCLPSSR